MQTDVESLHGLQIPGQDPGRDGSGSAPTPDGLTRHRAEDASGDPRTAYPWAAPASRKAATFAHGMSGSSMS